MTTAVPAPRAGWSALPGVAIAMMLFAGSAQAGLAPIQPGEASNHAIVPQSIEEWTPPTEFFDQNGIILDRNPQLRHAQTASSRVVGGNRFEVFPPGSRVAGRIWPGDSVPVQPISRAAQATTPGDQSAPGDLSDQTVSTAIPVPPALQSGLVGMAGLGLIGLARRVKRTLR